ncbi:MAG: nickel-dependent lactate racemase [Syntrophomonadaceae bacterium]|jgi:nickel-dependent lactate racemase|nr:nickel-dependent lactate racemase [Syntrophomonadaceae bacterium]
MIKLAFGHEFYNLEIEEKNFRGFLKTKPSRVDADNKELVEQALSHPVGGARLQELAEVKKARSAAVIVNDITRPTPYYALLPPLLEELRRAGLKNEDIKLVVALGIHRPHSEKENREIFGEEIVSRYEVLNHNCDADLKTIGVLSNGWPLEINRTAAEADLLIATGVVELHYFAGYSGGRKSILPGIASRKLIEANHQMMDDPKARTGNYKDNPVNDIMLEAAGKAGMDFILNVVMLSKDQIGLAVAGDFRQAWKKAVAFCEEQNVITIEEPADIVIASAGGYPKDISMYQAQKSLDAALAAVKKNGTVVLLAECGEGLGEAAFMRWIDEAVSPEDIKRRFYQHFELGGHKAFAICKALEHCQVILVSKLGKALTEKMFMEAETDLQAAYEKALRRQGELASVYIMPEAPKLGIKIKD